MVMRIEELRPSHPFQRAILPHLHPIHPRDPSLPRHRQDRGLIRHLARHH